MPGGRAPPAADERCSRECVGQWRGVTVLELLIVMAIAAVLAALAAPSFGSLRRAAGVSTATAELLGALHFARSSAVLNGLRDAVPVRGRENLRAV